MMTPDDIIISILKNGPTNGLEIILIILLVIFMIGFTLLFIGGMLSFYWAVRDEYNDWKNGIVHPGW